LWQWLKKDKSFNWLHPADIVSVNDTKGDSEDQLWHIFTDGSKSEQGVGSGVAVFTGKVLTKQLKFKLDNRCSNNQAEKLAIIKALEVIESQENQNEHIHRQQDNTGLNKERQKSQPPRRRNQEQSSNPEQKEMENRI